MKTILKISIIVVILAAAVFLEHTLVDIYQSATEELEEANPVRNMISNGVNQKIAVTLRIDFDNGNVKNYNRVELGEEKTVFDLLKKVTEENNLEFSFREYPDLGVLIESIDSAKNNFENNKWWQYWVNGQYATKGADKYELKNNDLVEWKYIKSQF